MRGSWHGTLGHKTLNKGMLHVGHHCMLPIAYAHTRVGILILATPR